MYWSVYGIRLSPCLIYGPRFPSSEVSASLAPPPMKPVIRRSSAIRQRLEHCRTFRRHLRPHPQSCRRTRRSYVQMPFRLPVFSRDSRAVARSRQALRRESRRSRQPGLHSAGPPALRSPIDGVSFQPGLFTYASVQASQVCA